MLFKCPPRKFSDKASEVADLANLVSLAVLVDVFIGHFLSGQLLDCVKSFQGRIRILSAARLSLKGGRSPTWLISHLLPLTKH